jgi:hypothetical protein
LHNPSLREVKRAERESWGIPNEEDAMRCDEQETEHQQLPTAQILNQQFVEHAEDCVENVSTVQSTGSTLDTVEGAAAQELATPDSQDREVQKVAACSPEYSMEKSKAERGSSTPQHSVHFPANIWASQPTNAGNNSHEKSSRIQPEHNQLEAGTGRDTVVSCGRNNGLGSASKGKHAKEREPFNAVNDQNVNAKQQNSDGKGADAVATKTPQQPSTEHIKPTLCAGDSLLEPQDISRTQPCSEASSMINRKQLSRRTWKGDGKTHTYLNQLPFASPSKPLLWPNISKPFDAEDPEGVPERVKCKQAPTRCRSMMTQVDLDFEEREQQFWLQQKKTREHHTLLSILQHRLATTRSLRALWKRGCVRAVFQKVFEMAQGQADGIVADFFSSLGWLDVDVSCHSVIGYAKDISLSASAVLDGSVPMPPSPMPPAPLLALPLPSLELCSLCIAPLAKLLESQIEDHVKVRDSFNNCLG